MRKSILGIPREESKRMMGNVPIEIAAKVMGKSPLWVREAIAQNRLDIGGCIAGKNGRRSFYISPKKFEELTGYHYEGSEK